MKLPEQKPTDDLARTDWFDPGVQPTIPGHYECTLGSGSDYVFKRRFDGEHWYSPVVNTVSRVKLPWRGIVPHSIPLTHYPKSLHFDLSWSHATSEFPLD